METILRKIIAAVLTLLSLSIIDAAGSLYPQEEFKIKVDAALVTTNVTVVGAAATELHADDFIIYDNDVAQTATYFSRDQIPLAVAILVDRSLSVQKYMPMLQIAAVSALRRLKPEDQVALFAFDFSLKKLKDLTEDRFLIADEIGKINNQLGTNIYDAIHGAAGYLKKKAPQRRRAVILVSDNIRMGASGNTAEGVCNDLMETATTLYSIRTPADFGPPVYYAENLRSFRETDPEVRRMAEETGGEALVMNAETSIQAALEKIISNLRLQYTIGFNPSDPGDKGSLHRLSVKLAAEDRCPGCRLLTRSGYYSGVTVPLPPPVAVTKSPQATAQKSEKSLIQRNILTAGTANLELTDISFTVKTTRQADSNGQPQINVDCQIDFGRIVFTTIENLHSCKLHMTVFYADAKGKILGSDWKVLEGQLKEATYDQAMKSGVLLSTTVPLKVPNQILKIVIYDEQSDRVGSKMIKIP
jgi:Ca-activated chloride channel homolog